MGRIASELWRDVLRLHPLVYLAAAFLAGIRCGYAFDALHAALAFAVAAALLAATFRTGAWRFRRLAYPALIACFMACGVARSAYEVRRQAQDLSLVSETERAVEVECGVVRVIGVKNLKGRSAQYRLAVKNPQFTDGSHRFLLPLEVNWYGDRDAARAGAPAAGELWHMRGRLYHTTLRNGRRVLVLNSGESGSRRVRRAREEAFAGRIAALRDGAARRVAIGIEDWGSVADINRAVLLGVRENVSRDMKRIFTCSGTIHVFAISGLHIALIAAVFVFLISCCGIPRYYWLFALAPLLTAYTLATGMRASAMRAALMALFFFCAPLFGRRFNTLTALAASALLVHAYQPSFISDIGSILSFSVMLGLITLYRPFALLIEKPLRVNALRDEAALLTAADEPARARRLTRRAALLSLFAGLCAVTVSAWLASLPLSAYYFGRITPGGVLANLLISPCALMLVIAGVLGYAASFVWGALASVFNHAAGAFTCIMIKTAECVSRLPFASIRVERFPLWLVWLWFAALFLGAWLLRRRVMRGDSGLEWM